MTRHSDKAIKTLELMHTTADEWHHTPVRWVEERVEVDGWVTCPTCVGSGRVCFDDAGEVIAPPAPNTDESFGYRNAARKLAGWQSNCPECKFVKCPVTYVRARKYGARAQGVVPGKVTATILVGYPEWPKGTRFDARFADGGYRCHLCNKAIKKSARCPVNTDGAEPHGMWVGESCARKFLGVKPERKGDAQVAGD